MARVSGRDAIKKAIKEYGGGMGFFSLKEDKDQAIIRFLHTDDADLDVFVVHKVEVDGKDVYVECLQSPDCPLCAAGNKASVKVFLSMYSEKDDRVLVWDRGPGIIDEILGLIDEYGYLNNRNYKIVRHGKAGDTKTRYQLFASDKAEFTIKGSPAPLPDRPKIIGNYVKEYSKEDMERIADEASSVPDRRNRGAGQRKGPGF